MAKPQGGLHKKERKARLESHAKDYVKYRQGKLEYEYIYVEVQELEAEGVKMSEIVEAREKALKAAGMLV